MGFHSAALLPDLLEKWGKMASTGEGNLMADWAELLPDLLILIAKRIHLYEDFVSFGGVCRSWRSVAVKDNFNHSRVQVPWLMLAKQEKDGQDDYQSFASLSKGGMVHRVFLPEARGKHCISSMGWLISTDRQNNNMELLHPLSRRRIPLPPPPPEISQESAIPDMRAVFSANPSFTDDYAVMVIIALQLYFWKPGNQVWSEVSPHCSYYDVVYYKDQFYAIDTELWLSLCDTNSGNVRIVELAIDTYSRRVASLLESYKCAFLVESAGELLVVIREGYNYVVNRGPFSVRVYKYYDSAGWKEIDNLGGGSIFVGRAVPATATAEIKPNCIYFTESVCLPGNIYKSYMNVEIYNLEKKTFETLPEVARPGNSYFPRLWVTPSFG